ncbi:YeeE/YedE family protein [bacterium]|nr:YeeE/YedE family protein [bacterium]
MKAALGAYLSGLIFAIGLAISGMTQPKKVLAFLDVLGDWDPSLMFVMVGAIGIYSVAYRSVLKKEKPILENKLQIPEPKKVDKPLIIGAALFGIGWGLAGFCPGPALTSLGTLQATPLIFTVGLFGGMFLFKILRDRKLI